MIKPDLVLRLAVAGNRELQADTLDGLQSRLREVFGVLDQRLAELAPGVPVPGPEPALTKFYSDNPPTLRLVSGLADGADQVAAQSLRQQPAEHVRHELTAVIPFDTETYLTRSPVKNQTLFHELRRACRHVIELDGRYESNPRPDLADDPVNDFAKQCRARAYRAQSAVLLRQCDLLIAIAQPGREGKAGGTWETMNRALDLGLPVLFLPLGTDRVALLRTPSDLEPALTNGTENWQSELVECVTDLLANPLAARPGPHHAVTKASSTGAHLHLRSEEAELLEEYFSDKEPHRTLRRWLWEKFEARFKQGPKPKSDPPLVPFETFRRRATTLNYHYSGLYRGTFLLNYLLAVTAVTLAVLSLILLMGMPKDAPPNHRSATTAEPLAVHAVEAESAPAERRNDLHAESSATATGEFSPHVWWLLGLALAKLSVLIVILRSTHAANHHRWNDKAVDYRYLAERLRSMYYLPRIGSFHPPAPSSAQYASRILRQSVVDWLFQAIVRHAAPIGSVHIPEAEAQPALIRTDIPAAVIALRDGWMGNQVVYHESNALTMGRMLHTLEQLGLLLNKSVIGVVVVDLALLIAELGHWVPEGWEHRLHVASPWLLFFAAVLPAAVASLNGIRFQSECARLADRSGHLAKILAAFRDRAEALHQRISITAASTSLGSWTLDAIELADTCARVTLDEAAEWSVLYAKELAEP